MEKLKKLVLEQLKLIEEFNILERDVLESEVCIRVNIDYENLKIGMSDCYEEDFKEYKIYEFNKGLEWSIEGDMSGWDLECEVNEQLNSLSIDSMSKEEYILKAGNLVYAKERLETIYREVKKNDKLIKLIK